MPAARLDTLNPQQRRAVEHGGDTLGDSTPLLIIAGAGSGKTNTLAHRVAHLIARGANPRRFRFLSSPRGGGAKMPRGVDRILAEAAIGKPVTTAASIPWAGTFHSI